jgi:hypothetical protein
MDREFIGYQWLKWLRKTGIPFCVRVPKHHQITLSNGSKVKAEELLKEGKRIYLRDVFVDLTRVNVSISLDSNGDLLYLIGTAPCSELGKIYRKRWSIEVFFQALKARGFNLEMSCLKSLEKYKKLFAIVSMAYTICWATGIEDGRTNPVKVKKHGYPQYSSKLLSVCTKKTAPESSDAVCVCSCFLFVVKVLFSYLLDYLPAPSKT